MLHLGPLNEQILLPQPHIGHCLLVLALISSYSLYFACNTVNKIAVIVVYLVITVSTAILCQSIAPEAVSLFSIA
jgi:hypothetical protein